MADCTQQWTEPLNVLSVFHHSHFMGTHQEIIVERDGVNLGQMRKEFKYDYNHQTGRDPVTALKTLYPGDRLAATCHFDTTSVSSDEVVEIGEESNKEMCFPGFLYYSRQATTAYAYFPPEAVSSYIMADKEWCLSPPTTAGVAAEARQAARPAFDNLCAEKLVADIPAFYNRYMEDYSGPSFSMMELCNSPGDDSIALKESLLDVTDGIPICPSGCSESLSCTEEALVPHAHAICEAACSSMGLSVYPDTSSTELHQAVNIACPTVMFDPPTLAEPETCQSKGSLPVSIELTGVEVIEIPGAEEEIVISEEEPSSGFATPWSVTVAMSAAWIGGMVI